MNTLASCDVIAFVATTEPDRAREFYETVLGLHLIEEQPFALVFDANGTMLRIAKIEELTPAQYTVLGWAVSDIAGAVIELQRKGVTFERFEGFDQDDLGIWRSPDGASVAWFRDPDGNMLSLTQLPSGAS